MSAVKQTRKIASGEDLAEKAGLSGVTHGATHVIHLIADDSSKWVDEERRENQRLYFGKKGHGHGGVMLYYLDKQTHCLKTIDYHAISTQYESQNAQSTNAKIEAVIAKFCELLVPTDRVFATLFMDNGPAFKSEAVFRALPSSIYQAPLGRVVVADSAHFETQHGESALDQTFSVSGRKLRQWVASGHDLQGEEGFLSAIRGMGIPHNSVFAAYRFTSLSKLDFESESASISSKKGKFQGTRKAFHFHYTWAVDESAEACKLEAEGLLSLCCTGFTAKNASNDGEPPFAQEVFSSDNWQAAVDIAAARASHLLPENM